MTYENLLRRQTFMDFFDELDARFYYECHPQPGGSSCYGEYAQTYYTYITKYIWRNLDKIADRIGLKSDGYTQKQLDAAWDLVDWNLMTGALVYEVEGF